MKYTFHQGVNQIFSKSHTVNNSNLAREQSLEKRHFFVEKAVSTNLNCRI